MKIAYDLTAFRAKPAFERCWPTADNKAVKFVMPNRTDIIIGRLVDDGANIEIFPDRSSAHKALRDALEG